MNDILPAINLDKLQEAANAAAMKGAVSTIEEFYSGYNSPYKKAIEEHLKGKGSSFSMELPDIIAVLNDSIANEIDTIANAAIAKSFIPLVKRFFTRVEAEITFSDILKQFIECSYEDDPSEYSVSVEKHESYDWLNVEISCNLKTYKITLHEDWASRNEPQKKYKLLSLPHEDKSYHKTMKLSVDGGATLEMPFCSDVLKDEFLSYMARIIIADSKITIDTRDFDDDMFPNSHCHCD